MPEPRPLSEDEEALLAAFADGQLGDDERADVERRLASDADLARAYERQRAGMLTIASAVESVSAPLALRSRVEAMQRGEAPAGATRRRFRLPSWMPAAAIATAAAVAFLAVVL